MRWWWKGPPTAWPCHAPMPQTWSFDVRAAHQLPDDVRASIGPPFRKLDRLAEDTVLLASLGDLMRFSVSETSGG